MHKMSLPIAGLVLLLATICTNAYSCIASDEELKAGFDEADTNHDGYLSEEEYFESSSLKSLTPEQHRGAMQEMDKNGDGKISFDEYVQYRTTHSLTRCG